MYTPRRCRAAPRPPGFPARSRFRRDAEPEAVTDAHTRNRLYRSTVQRSPAFDPAPRPRRVAARVSRGGARRPAGPASSRAGRACAPRLCGASAVLQRSVGCPGDRPRPCGQQAEAAAAPRTAAADGHQPLKMACLRQEQWAMLQIPPSRRPDLWRAGCSGSCMLAPAADHCLPRTDQSQAETVGDAGASSTTGRQREHRPLAA